MIKIIKLRLRSLDNKYLKKAGGHTGRNVVENNNKDEDNRAKTLNDKNHQASSQKFRQLLLCAMINMKWGIILNIVQSTVLNFANFGDFHGVAVIGTK